MLDRYGWFKHLYFFLQKNVLKNSWPRYVSFDTSDTVWYFQYHYTSTVTVTCSDTIISNLDRDETKVPPHAMSAKEHQARPFKKKKKEEHQAHKCQGILAFITT